MKLYIYRATIYLNFFYLQLCKSSIGMHGIKKENTYLIN